MSHFASMKTQITDRPALVTGLQNLLTRHGIPGIVEVHETPMILENAYDRDVELQYANVILRRLYSKGVEHYRFFARTYNYSRRSKQTIEFWSRLFLILDTALEFLYCSRHTKS